MVTFFLRGVLIGLLFGIPAGAVGAMNFDIQLHQIFVYWILGMVIGSLVSVFAIRLVNTASNNKQIVLNKKSVTLAAGKSQKLSVRNLPDTAKVTWKSSKKSVASETY